MDENECHLIRALYYAASTKNLRFYTVNDYNGLYYDAGGKVFALFSRFPNSSVNSKLVLFHTKYCIYIINKERTTITRYDSVEGRLFCCLNDNAGNNACVSENNVYHVEYKFAVGGDFVQNIKKTNKNHTKKYKKK